MCLFFPRLTWGINLKGAYHGIVIYGNIQYFISNPRLLAGGGGRDRIDLSRGPGLPEPTDPAP